MTEAELLAGLNPSQEEAVKNTLTVPSLVLAGAGSGKTRVLTNRIAYIHSILNEPTKGIMAVTFTNKAAKEMVERLEKAIGKQAAKDLTVGTFHSICSRILRKHANDVGLTPDFTIADTTDQKAILKSLCARYVGDSTAQTVNAYLGMISDLKNKLIQPSGVSTSIYKKDKDLEKVYRAYQSDLLSKNMVDFDDLLMKVVNLLDHNPGIRLHYQRRYKWVHADEYQDTNTCQYMFLKLIVGDPAITGNNIFVVGDADQGIYSWRGADIQNILNFQADYPNAKVVKLEQNYRSTQVIVEAGNAIVANNKNRLDKVTFTSNVTGDKIKQATLTSDIDEAAFIVGEIKNQVKFNGRNYEDFAVLYRANFQSQTLEKELVKQMVPYTIVGHIAFYDRAEIKDTLAYLRVITNPRDDIAMKRVIGLHPGIGKTTVDKVEEISEQQGISIMEALKAFTPTRAMTAEAINDLRELLNKMYMIARVTVASESDPDSQGVVVDLLDIIWRRTNYIDKLKEENSRESLDRIENLRELVKVAQLYQDTSPAPTVAEFLQETSLQSEQAKKKDSNVVKLMTLHASKGLEFPIVFLSGMEEGVFPHRNSLINEEALEEERRLAYVGITRAEEELYLTLAKQRRDYQGIKRNNPSRFLAELPSHLVMEV